MADLISQSYFYFIKIFMKDQNIDKAINLAIDRAISIKISVAVGFFELFL